jgi:hypothetical protein
MTMPRTAKTDLQRTQRKANGGYVRFAQKIGTVISREGAKKIIIIDGFRCAPPILQFVSGSSWGVGG